MKYKFLPASILAVLASAIPGGVYAALPDKTLVYCSEGSPAGFDPGQYMSEVEYSASAEPIYNRLVDFKRGATQLIPALAERWAISSDGRTYTFYLRRDVKFHTTPWFKPTREFNAEDVRFTFERMRNPNMPFRRAYPTEFPYWNYTGFDKLIKKIEVLDSYTVRFILNSANAPFLVNLADPSASILSAEYAAQLLKADKPFKINRKPVGTGPFIFQEYVKDATIRFKGNPEYWQPHDVQLSNLIFTVTPEAATRAQKLKVNECQIMSNPRPVDIAPLKADPNLQVFSQPGFNIGYLAYNVTHKPLNDVRVRRALDMAINKKAIIDVVYEGHAQIAVAPMPPLQWSYDKTLKDTPRHFKQAKKLLTQAGYPDGFTLSLWAMPVERPYNPNSRLMAEMIQADWKKIGVTAKIVTYEWAEYIKRAFNGEHDSMLIGSNENADPSNWLRYLSCRAVRTSNFSKWCHTSFDNLIQKAEKVTDMDQRISLYLKAQRIFKREQPFTPIAYSMIYQPLNKNVINFKISPFGTVSFSGVSLK